LGNKLSYEYVYDYFKSFGYELLEKEYINSNTKMKFICPKGHSHEIAYGKFQSGRRCAICSNRKKIEVDDVIENLNKDGYSLIEGFVNTNSKVSLRCPNGHIWNVSYRAYLEGRRCTKCFGRYRGENLKFTKWNYDLVTEFINSKSYKLLSSDYKNSHSKLKMRCDNGHYIDMSFSHFTKGHRCKICSSIKTAIKQRNSEKEIDKILNENGYIRLNKYISNKHKLKVLCPEGHNTEIIMVNFNRGVRCKICKASKLEKKFISILEDFNVDYVYEESVKIKDNHYYFDFAIYSNKKFICYIELDG